MSSLLIPHYMEQPSNTLSIYVLASKKLLSFKNCLSHRSGRTMLIGNKGEKSPYPQEMSNLKGGTI